MKRIEVEHRAYEYKQRKNYDDATYYLVDYDNAAVVKLVPHLIYQPCQAEPPQQGTAYYAEIAYAYM